MFPSLRIFTNAASRRAIPTSREVKDILSAEVPTAGADGILPEPSLSPLPFTPAQITFLRSLLPLKIEDAVKKLDASEHNEPILHALLNPPVETDSTPREALEFLLRPPSLDEWVGDVKSHIPLPAGFNNASHHFPGPINWDAAWSFVAKFDPKGQNHDLLSEIVLLKTMYEVEDQIAKHITLPSLDQLPQLADFPKLFSLQWDRWRAFGTELFEVIDELAQFREALDKFMINLPNLTIRDIEEAYPEWGEEVLPVLEQRQWAFDESATVYHDDHAAAIEDEGRAAAVTAWMKNWDESEKKFLNDFFDGQDVTPPPISLWHLLEITPAADPAPRVDIIQSQFVSGDPNAHAEHH